MRNRSSFAALLAPTVVFAIAFVGGPGRADEGGPGTAAFRWIFEPGQQLRYELKVKNTVRTTFDGRDSADFAETIFDLTMTVDSVAEDGSADLKLKVDRVQASRRIAGKKNLYDSRSEAKVEPAARPFAEAHEVALAGTYRLRLNARGGIDEVEAPDGLTEALKSSPFLALDAGGPFSPEGLEAFLGPLIPTFPEGALMAGSTWTEAHSFPQPPVGLAIALKWAVKSIGPADARLESSTVITAEPIAGPKLSVSVTEGVGTGTATFDLENGRALTSVLKQTVKTALIINGKEGSSVAVKESSLTFLPEAPAEKGASL